MKEACQQPGASVRGPCEKPLPRSFLEEAPTRRLRGASDYSHVSSGYQGEHIADSVATPHGCSVPLIQSSTPTVFVNHCYRQASAADKKSSAEVPFGPPDYTKLHCWQNLRTRLKPLDSQPKLRAVMSSQGCSVMKTTCTLAPAYLEANLKLQRLDSIGAPV